MEEDSIYYTIDFGVNFANKKRYPNHKLVDILKKSYHEGVDKVVSISNNFDESITNLKLSEEFENLHFTIGIHPHNASSMLKNKDKFIEFIDKNIINPKCFGIGECGLDYNRMFSPKEDQLLAFHLQIELAQKYNKPLYLHCRDAYDDFIQIIKEHTYYKGLVHCFTGNIHQAIELTSLGFKLGITGWLLDKRRNKDLVQVIKDKRITIEMLVVETDAPFMAIHPSKESIPTDTGYIVEEIARLKQIDLIMCGKKIYQNSIQLLNC